MTGGTKRREEKSEGEGEKEEADGINESVEVEPTRVVVYQDRCMKMFDGRCM